MKIVKSSKKFQENLLNIVLLVGGVLLIMALYHYSSNKGMVSDAMQSGSMNMPTSVESEVQGAPSSADAVIKPAGPNVMGDQFSSVDSDKEYLSISVSFKRSPNP